MNNRTKKFIRNKAIHFIVLMLAVAIFSFILLELSPIDPVNAYLKQAVVSPEQRMILEQYWGVNQPLTTKIWGWLVNLLQGNLGNSLIYRIPVTEVIMERFMASFVLMAISWVISGLIGFGLGIVAGKNKGGWIDKAVKLYCYVLQSAPYFWIGLVILIIFSVELGWFPIGMSVAIGTVSSEATIWQWLARLVLPTLTLSLVGVAPIAMYTRNELVNVLSSDYILFARARGESGWPLIERQALRNTLLPALTLQFQNFYMTYIRH